MRRRSLAGAATFAVALTTTLTACGGGGSTSSNASGCKPAHSFPTVKSGTLTVSTYVSPPYTVLARAGSDVGGVDGEIVKKIAAMECLDVQANPVAGAALIESVATKRADVGIGGVYRTPQRAQTLSLSDTMYRDGMALLSKSGASSLADLEGKKVGVIQGYLWNADLQKALGTDHVTVYQDSDSMIADLQAGRVDAAVLTSAEAAYRQKQAGGNLKVEQFKSDPAIAASTAPGEVILASPKGADKMTAAFDADIKKLLSDGTIAGVLKQNGMDPSLAGPAS